MAGTAILNTSQGNVYSALPSLDPNGRMIGFDMTKKNT